MSSTPDFRFSCTRCSGCCKLKYEEHRKLPPLPDGTPQSKVIPILAKIWMEPVELHALLGDPYIQNLGIESVSQLYPKFFDLDIVRDDVKEMYKMLINHNDTGYCVFFNPESGCQIYNNRPLQCRLFPYGRSISFRLSEKTSRDYRKIYQNRVKVSVTPKPRPCPGIKANDTAFPKYSARQWQKANGLDSAFIQEYDISTAFELWAALYVQKLATDEDKKDFLRRYINIYLLGTYWDEHNNYLIWNHLDQVYQEIMSRSN